MAANSTFTTDLVVDLLHCMSNWENLYCFSLTLKMGSVVGPNSIESSPVKSHILFNCLSLKKHLSISFNKHCRLCALCIHLWNWEPHQPVQHQWSLGAPSCSSEYHNEGSTVHWGWDQHRRGERPQNGVNSFIWFDIFSQKEHNSL